MKFVRSITNLVAALLFPFAMVFGLVVVIPLIIVLGTITEVAKSFNLRGDKWFWQVEKK